MPLQHGPHGFSLATGWLVLLAAIGIAVVFLAKRNLERVADAIEMSFSRAIAWGLVAQLALFPILLLVVVALVLTILGILVIPFAIVAYFTAAAGAIALGFLAMAFVVGDALGRRLGHTLFARSPTALLFVGLLPFYLVWLVPVVLPPVPLLGAVVRLFATAITWVAATVGLGAALLTRGGTRDAAIPPPEIPTPDEDQYAWQTPTPVSGVTAARRPTPVPPTTHDPV
jgi:hypothetical protein